MLKTKSNRAIWLRVVLLACAVALLAGIAACKRTEVKTGDVDQTKTVEDLKIAGTITFTVNNESGTEAESMAPRAVVRAFMNQFPNAVVKYEESNRGNYPARISSGDIGDVFWCDAEDANNYMRNHNALMPLDAYIKPMGIDLGDIYSGALETGKIAGRLYMSPRKIGEQLLIYNVTMLQAAGIEFDNSIATPWEEFKQICRQLTIIENGTVEQCGASFKIDWSPVWQMFFRGYGGKWIDNKEHKVMITESNEVMAGINEIIAGVQEGWLYPEDMSGNISSTWKYGFSDGDANVAHVCFKTFGAMTWLTRYGNNYDSLKIDWDFCPFPAFPNHNISTGATGYVVYNRTDNPDTAAAFALFFLTEAGQRAYHSQTGGNVPLLKSLAEDDFWKAKGTEWENKNYAAFVAYPDNTVPSSVITQAPSEIATMFSREAMRAVFAKIINGQSTAEDAFNKLETQANEKWKTLLND